MKNVSFKGFMHTKEPVVHLTGDAVSGDRNTQACNKMKVLEGESVYEAPVVNGNSFRGILRDLGAASYFTSKGLEVDHLEVFWLFFSGGQMAATKEKNKKGKTVKSFKDADVMLKNIAEAIGVNKALLDSSDYSKEFYEAITKNTFLSLFGGAVGKKIISGKMSIHPLLAIAKEYVSQIDSGVLKAIANNVGVESFPSVADLTDRVQFTRKDDTGDSSKWNFFTEQGLEDVLDYIGGAKVTTEADEEADPNVKQQRVQGIYRTEVITKGAYLSSVINFKDVETEHIDIFTNMLESFAKSPRIGGGFGKGNGFVDFWYDIYVDGEKKGEIRCIDGQFKADTGNLF